MPRSTSTIFALVALIAVFVLYRYIGDYTSAGTSTTSVQDPGGYAEWKEFTAPSGNFKGIFPLTPKQLSESSQDPRSHAMRRYNIYIAEQLDSTVYMVTTINFTEKFNPEQDSHILANTIADMVASNAQNTLVSTTEETFQGRKALKFNIDNGKAHHIIGLTFVADKTLFIITRISKNEKNSDEDFDHFVKGFTIISAPAEVAQPVTPAAPAKVNPIPAPQK